jgi:hypothetical protein
VRAEKVIVNVYPGATNPSHEISLSDGVQTWGLHLDGGPEALREEPLTPSTLRFNGGVSSFGAWEPGMAQIEQRDWSGGRGLERFSAENKDSSNRFYDSQNAWTLTPGKLLPGPQLKFARGLRTSIQHLPGDVSWKALFGSQRFVSAAFTVGSAAFAAKQARIWLRRVGSPGALSLLLHQNSGGVPGAAILNAGQTISIADVPDVVSQFRSFDLSAMSGNLSASMTVHVVLNGAASDNAANHWEIGVQDDGAGGHVSADGSSWSPAGFCPYFRLEDAGLARNFIFFRLGGSLYAVDQRANGSASHVYINGDRGVVTSAAAQSLTDTHKNWGSNEWTGAWVRIYKGKGVGQAREILSNASSTLSVAAWDQTPDTTSEYVIYASDEWKDISPISGDLIDGVVKDVVVVNDHALFAQGDVVPVLRMRFNAAAGTPTHEFDDDGANTADLLHSFHHPQYGPQVWRALVALGEASRAAPTAWLTALTFGAGIKVGEKSQTIREIFDWNSQLWILKSDSFWQMNDSDQAKRVNAGLESIPRETGCQPLALLGGQVFFGWRDGLLAYSGSVLADVSPGCLGAVAALQPLGAGRMAVAIDGGSQGTSSVRIWDGSGWHELLRAPQAGIRIQGLACQDCPGARPQLWVAMGGDLAYVELPRETADPLAETNFAYQHEAVLIGGAIDMGAAKLPKFIREVGLLSSNLTSGTQVQLDYQLDGEIGGSAWRSAGAFYSSPLDALPLNLGQLHAIRPQLRLLTNRATRPPVVQATVVEGFARTPLKYQWTLRTRLAGGGQDDDPDAFVAWLQQAAREARKIHMRAIFAALDDKYVITEPPSVVRESVDAAAQSWGGTATVVVREA